MSQALVNEDDDRLWSMIAAFHDTLFRNSK